ncbi:carboxypeptidase-like regulatory domain-containing protein [Novosphingobium sp.]|uniref:MSCRAMM family protein n=1 Tax=Novosphingobium sp. TaxID=1874826 RepID=UPI00286C1445|nr:carboxypeptidase-like regulatory domain-containing protein [Novosphingobium sp.]
MTTRFSTLRQAAAAFAAAFAVWSAPAQAEVWVPGEDDVLLLELHSGNYRIGDTLRGYQTPDGICVDFGDLIQTLDLPVRLDKKSRRATGWLFAEDQKIVIDRDSNMVQTMNGHSAIAPTAIRDTPEGWCMDLGALSGWLGVRLRPDLQNMALMLESDKPLPAIEALNRKSRAARLSRPKDNQFDLAALPQAEAPYRSWRTPSVDVQVQAQWTTRDGFQTRYEGLAAGEVAGLSYGARVAASDSALPNSLRIGLFRNDPSGQLLGPLGATRFAFGDVETQPTALSSQSAFGRGAFVTNRPLGLPARFGVTTLRGVLPAGWDAELYRNGELRGYQSDRGDGRYEFIDVELDFGENEFDVVLYGPQGQVRHVRSNLPVGIESLPAGKTWYWAGAVEDGRDLIGLGGQPADPLTGWRWGWGIERGLNRRTTIGMSYNSVLRGGGREHYFEGVLRRSMGPMLIELSAAQQMGAGRAWRAETIGRLGGVRVAAHVLWIDGNFDSEQVDAQINREYDLRLGGTLHLGNWRLPVEGGVRQTLSRRGVKVTEVLTRGSFRISRATLTVELLHRAVNGDPANALGEDSGWAVSLIGSGVIGRVHLRGQAEFGIDGNRPGLRRVQLVVDAPLSDRSNLRGSIEVDGQADLQTYSLGYVQQFPRFALRAEGRIDSQGHVGMGLTFAFSLGPDPAGGGWRFSRERLAEQGQASIEVFRDDNGDGQRQRDEPAIEGVQVEAGFRHAEMPTNKAGRTVIDGLFPYVPVMVSIDAGSISDPLLRPKVQGVVVTPRPGVAAVVSLPLAPTGEVEALLLGPDGQALGGITVELTDGAGRVLFQTVSDFDGYVLFDNVPYGQYRLRIDPKQAAALSVQPGLGDPLRIDQRKASLRLGRVRLAAQPAIAANGQAP